MGRVFCYARASTLDQEDTIKIQEEKCREAFERRFSREHTWGGVFADQGVSGGVDLSSRPAGARMLLELKPGDVVMIAKLDRGFRSARDCLNQVERWTQASIALCLLDLDADTGSIMGRLLISVLVSFAQFERDRMMERLKENIRYRKKKGRPLNGNPPYGYRVVGPEGAKYLQRDAYTRKVGRKIVEWVDGGWTFTAVYWHLLREKVKTSKNKSWSRTAIERAYRGEKALHLKEKAKLEKLEGEEKEKGGQP